MEVELILYVLVVWFGISDTQSSFAVSGIASAAECERLGKALSRRKQWVNVQCEPYRAGR